MGAMLRVLLAAVVLAVAGVAARAAEPVEPELTVDDVSWLFPMPKSRAGLDTVISMAEVLGAGGGPAWSDSAMAQYFKLAIENSKVEGTERVVNIPAELRARAVWRISGVRIDPGAPGVSGDIAEAFGQQPQIRLIAQPVVAHEDGSVEVFDVAAHLIFSFVVDPSDAPAGAGCFPRPVPDLDKTRAIAEDLMDIKTRLAAGGIGGVKITTNDNKLGLHPALTNAATRKAFRGEVLAFLNKWLPQSSPSSMAIAGIPLPDPEPWIFLAMQGLMNDGRLVFVPVASPALDGRQVAQMLSFIDTKNILPVPAPNNLNPITCRHAAVPGAALPVEGRKGLATAELFDGAPSKDRVNEIVDLIGDPAQSHFFNVDCLSCHTDTRLGVTHLGEAAFPGVERNVLPRDQWNVRNFGWFPAEGPTATNRTFREAFESAEAFNALLRAR